MKITPGSALLTVFSCVLLLYGMTASAQQADDLRGGWISDDGGTHKVMVLVIRNDRVSGTWCETDCRDPANLAFIDDGLLSEGSLSFDLYHDPDNGAAEVTEVEGRLENGRLILGFLSDPFTVPTRTFTRSPRETRPAPTPAANDGPATSYLPPAGPEQLSPENVAGLWVSGIGPGKQYFMFKHHQGGLRGMVCGPCTDASGMAPLENISIDGIHLHFDIVHENSGLGILEYGPHSNITDATVAKNEMHLVTRPGYADEDSALFQMTLLGPVEFTP